MYQIIHNIDNTRITIEAETINLGFSILRKARGLSDEDKLEGDLYTISWPDLQIRQELHEQV